MSHHGEPLRELFRLQDCMSRVFDELTQGRTRHGGQDGTDVERAEWVPAADLDEYEKDYVITVDLPGIDRSRLGIELEKDRLVIRGGRSIDHHEARRGERPAGRFLRRFDIPSNVNQAGISADYKDGLLMVRLPKCDTETPGRVRIQVH